MHVEIMYIIYVSFPVISERYQSNSTEQTKTKKVQKDKQKI